MLNNGLQKVVESLVDSVNLSQSVYHSTINSKGDDKWLNQLISESWAVITKQDQNPALECLIKMIVDKNCAHLKVLFKILSILIEENLYSYKDVACILVNSEPLKVSNKHYFRLCYSYINTLLPSLDYKSNREVFNKSIEKTHTFPDEVSTEDRRSLYYCLKVIRRLLSRKNNLMPAYFAMHELMKCFNPEDSEKQPHKLLQGEITSFMNSFRKPAKLLIPFCRCLFFPVVGLTHATNNNFRLDQSKLIYTNVQRGAILYSESISSPQLEECTNLLMQTRSSDLAVFLYDISRNNPSSKSVGLESAFSQLIYDFMVRIESFENPLNDLAWIMGTIEHLVCSELHFLHAMSIGFSEIFVKLNKKTEHKSWIKCRKYIWWFVINATSGFINKNTMEDFVPCLKFFDILYPANDKTWIEDISEALKLFGDSSKNHTLLNFECLNDFPPNGILSYFLDTGPLILWMHLIRKSKALPTNLPRNLPAALQPMFEVVNHEVRRLSGNDCFNALATMGWHELVMILNIYSTNSETTVVIIRVIEFLWCIKCQQPQNTLVVNDTTNNRGDLGTFSLPYGLRGQGRSLLIPNEIIFTMSVHVRLLLNHLLMISVFTDPQNSNSISPQLIESFCRLILHREMDIHSLNKFIDTYFLPKGSSLMSLNNTNTNGQSSPGNKNLDKRLFTIMLDILINRCSYYMTPEITMNLWASIVNHLSVQSDLPLQFQFQIDAAILQMSRYFQKPDMMLYGLCSHTMVHKIPRNALHPARLIGDTDDISKHVIITLIQLYKAYEMEDVISWKTFITDKVKLLQQKTSGVTNPGINPQPIWFSQLQFKEIPDSLMSSIGPLVTCAGAVDNANNSETSAETISFNSGFGCFKFSASTKLEFDNIINQVDAQISGNINYQNLKFEYWRKLMGTSYLYCVVLRIILEWKTITPAVISVTDQLTKRTSDQCLRSLCDYVVANVSLYIGQLYDSNAQSIDKILEALETFIIKFNIIPLDRFITFLLNRNFQNDTWRVVFILINDIFTKWSSLTSSLNYLCEQYPSTLGNPCHLNNWHNVHMKLHELLPEVLLNSHNTNQLILPQYYNHLLLRLIPVLELVISTVVHMPQAASVMTNFFAVASKLFRFHSYPLYFCYTLIRSQLMWTPENRRLMKMLIHHILQEHQPSQRYLSNAGWKILSSNTESDMDYDRITSELCRDLMIKLYTVFSTNGNAGIPYVNWRLDQSSSVQSHVVYAAVIELMLCGSSPQIVVESIIRLCQEQHGSERFKYYINIFGCVMSLFSKEYRQYATHQISSILSNSFVRSSSFINCFYTEILSDDCDVSSLHSDNVIIDLKVQLCLWHSMWTHANMTQISNCVSYVREFIRPCVQSEGQFLLACHMCGPLMWPLQTDKSGKLMELIQLVAELYHCLSQVPNNVPLVHPDTIADFMYHVKYIYVGNGVLEYIKELMPGFEEELRSKLKFIMPVSSG